MKINETFILANDPMGDVEIEISTSHDTNANDYVAIGQKGSFIQIPLSEFNEFVKLLRKLNNGLKYFKNGNGKEESEIKGE